VLDSENIFINNMITS